jgi:hypothetical protein
MEFVLRYRGPLIAQSSGKGSRIVEKQAIRRYLHPQLQDLWKTDTNRLADIRPNELQEPVRERNVFDVRRPIENFKSFFFRYSLGGFNFVPLVTAPQETRCRLAIRLHRATRPGDIVYSGGDLDNRLKVLFDALRMPHDAAELSEAPHSDGEVLYCLLADDRLITDFSIQSFRLLDPSSGDENYVEAEIGVTVQAVTPMRGSLSFLW